MNFNGEVLGIAQFCSLSFGDDFSLRSLGGKYKIAAHWQVGATREFDQEGCTLVEEEREKGNVHLGSKREKKKGGELVECRGHQGRERPTIINRERRLSFGKSFGHFTISTLVLLSCLAKTTMLFSTRDFRAKIPPLPLVNFECHPRGVRRSPSSCFSRSYIANHF